MMCSATIEVRIAVAESLPLIQADQGLLEQALVNIIRNAVVHAEGATLISDRSPRRGERVRADGRRQRERASRRVRSTGSSRNSSAARTRVQVGPGLGLSIVQGIVLAHGGSDQLCEPRRRRCAVHHPPAARHSTTNREC